MNSKIISIRCLPNFKAIKNVSNSMVVYKPVCKDIVKIDEKVKFERKVISITYISRSKKD